MWKMEDLREHDAEAEPLTLAIIEDEEPHYLLMKRVLEREFPEATLHHYTDAAACFADLDTIAPDVLITDYLTPGMNGIELMQALKGENRDIPVVMITGQGDENIAVRAMKLGAWDYLVKSADFFTLLPSIIQKIMRERRLREALREVRNRFRDLAESTTDWIWEIDARGRYIYSNPVVEKILGYPPGEVLGKPFGAFLIEEERERQNRAWLRLMHEHRPLLAQVSTLRHRDGRRVVVETNGVPVFDKTGSCVGYRGIDRDITLRKQAEEHIHYLTQQLMRAQEVERQKLSCDLHDVIGQDLSSLKIGLDTLLDGQEPVGGTLGEKVCRLSRQLQEAINAVRNMAYDLRPSALDELGLVRATHRHCEDFATRHDIAVDFVSAGIDEMPMDFDTRITLFRLIQEALNNINKHAEASRVDIRLVASYPKLILCIEDNGKGFDLEERLPTALRERCMGLQSMQERVALLEGNLKIESRPKQGTRIRIEVPCKEVIHESEKNDPCH